MSPGLAATVSINPGEHLTTKAFGLTLNVDTIYTTAIAGLIVLGMGFWLRSRVTSGVPGRIQLFWETVVGAVENQVETYIGPQGRDAVPLAVALFMFILFSDWLALIPTGTRPDHLPPPTSDVNLTYALALIAMFFVIRAGVRARGVGGYLRHFAEPKWWLTPINVLEEVTKPFTLALRLFGNIFSGVLMVLLISLLAPWALWPFEILWKTFDLFIGLIQAFIFALLTLLYYQFATAGGH